MADFKVDGVEIVIGENLTCPTCGATELHPDHDPYDVDTWVWTIRPNKVSDEQGS